MKFLRLNERWMKIKTKIFVEMTFSEWVLVNKQRIWILMKNNEW